MLAIQGEAFFKVITSRWRNALLPVMARFQVDSQGSISHASAFCNSAAIYHSLADATSIHSGFVMARYRITVKLGDCNRH